MVVNRKDRLREILPVPADLNGLCFHIICRRPKRLVGQQGTEQTCNRSWPGSGHSTASVGQTGADSTESWGDNKVWVDRDTGYLVPREVLQFHI